MIECLRWHTDSKGREANIGKLPSLGDCVRVCGKLKYPNWSGACGVREINVDCLTVLSDPNFELLFWLQAIKLGMTEYKSQSSDSKKRKANRHVSFAEPVDSRRRISGSVRGGVTETTTTTTTTIPADFETLI